MRRRARRCGTWRLSVCLRTTSPLLSAAPRRRCANGFVMELDRGAAEANAMISGYLFAAAKAGNTTAQIFWLKTRAGWKEAGSADSTVQDTGEPHPQAVL